MKLSSIIICSAALALFWGGGLQAATDVGPEAGKRAPAFTLKDAEGGIYTSARLSGKVALLNFWATTCGPCTAEMPGLNALYERLAKEGLVVVAVSVDSSEKAVRDFVREKRLAFPVLLDRDKEVYFDSYAVFGLPTSFLIDRKGVIVEKIIGPRDWESAASLDRIRRILNDK